MQVHVKGTIQGFCAGGSSRRATAVAVAASISLAASSAFAATYSITDVGVLKGDAYAFGFGINNGGNVVGESDNANGTSEGVFYNQANGSLTGLGTFDGTSGNGTAHAINATGIAVGSATAANGQTTAAFAVNTTTASPTLTQLPAGTTTTGITSIAYAINSSGVIVGQTQFTVSQTLTQPLAAEWTPNQSGGYTLTQLDPTGGSGLAPGSSNGANSVAYGINTSGYIVGQATNTAGRSDGFLYSSATAKFYDLGTVNADDGSSSAEAINASGVIVGNYVDSAGTPHAVSYSGYSTPGSSPLNGSYTELDPTGVFASSDAHAINGGGEVVGDATTVSTGDSVGFVFQPGTGIEDLNSLLPTGSGWDILSADGVNDGGQITGYGILDGVQSIYVLTPTASVPEPLMTGLLAGAGLLPLIQGRRHRR